MTPDYLDLDSQWLEPATYRRQDWQTLARWIGGSIGRMAQALEPDTMPALMARLRAGEMQKLHTL